VGMPMERAFEGVQMSVFRPFFRGEAVLRVDKGDCPIQGWDRPQSRQDGSGCREEGGWSRSLTIDGLEPVSGDPKAARMLCAPRPVSEVLHAPPNHFLFDRPGLAFGQRKKKGAIASLHVPLQEGRRKTHDRTKRSQPRGGRIMATIECGKQQHSVLRRQRLLAGQPGLRALSEGGARSLGLRGAYQE
jgi:hypothetical protein